MRRTAWFVGALCSMALSVPAQGPYDLVVSGGRVIDPETGLDAVRNVGIRGGRIVTVTTAPLAGTRTLDARGLVVAPGFIDMHQHQHDPEAYRLKALDGVTTALELETGVPDISAFVRAREGRTPINFGATASHEAARVAAWGLRMEPSTFGAYAGIPDPASGPVTNDPASDEQVARMLADLRRQLDAGALGIGIGLEYTPGASRYEVVELFRLAAEFHRPTFVHVRSAGHFDPGSSVGSVLEVIAAAAVSGASAHIVHLNSSCLRDAPACLGLIAGARARGLDVTTEAYPYGAGMTFINSALFNPGWQERRGITYSDVEIPETGERLTKRRFDQLHASREPRVVLIHMNPDSIVDRIVRDPLTAIASDGIREHPRGAGTYARILARYVREQGSLSLLEAVRKMSLMPAQRLETVTPAAHRKGRLQEGADADVVVFDPRRVADRATFRRSTDASVGMRYVLVAGTVIVNDGVLVDGAVPGRALMAARGPWRPRAPDPVVPARGLDSVGALGAVPIGIRVAAWRDFMPTPAGVVRGSDLMVSLQIEALRGATLPPGVYMDSAWVRSTEGLWATAPSIEPRPAIRNGLDVMLRGGPEWGPGRSIDVLLRLRLPSGERYLLRAPPAAIGATQ